MSILRQCTNTAIIKRSELAAGRKSNASALTIFTDVPCSPAYPVQVELTLDGTTKSVVGTHDIYLVGEWLVRQGDIIEVAGIRYTVKGVGEWKATRTKFTALAVERINP